MNKLLYVQRMATNLLKNFGSRATLTKLDGTNKQVYGVIMSGNSTDGLDGGNDFISGTQKTCYLEGKVTVPEPGDVIKFNTNIYAITKVNALSTDDVTKNVFAYKCEVSV